MRRFFTIIILITCFFNFLVAQDKEVEKAIRFILEGGIEYGGDEILKVFFTNGQSQIMRAGQGGLLAGGIRYQSRAIDWMEVRATIGLKANTTAADNANIYFVRYPINFLVYIDPTKELRIGGGITKHLQPNLDGDGFTANQSYSSPLGIRFEIGYKGLTISYTNVTYIDTLEEKYIANSFGLVYSHLF